MWCLRLLIRVQCLMWKKQLLWSHQFNKLMNYLINHNFFSGFLRIMYILTTLGIGSSWQLEKYGLKARICEAEETWNPCWCFDQLTHKKRKFNLYLHKEHMEDSVVQGLLAKFSMIMSCQVLIWKILHVKPKMVSLISINALTSIKTRARSGTAPNPPKWVHV